MANNLGSLGAFEADPGQGWAATGMHTAGMSLEQIAALRAPLAQDPSPPPPPPPPPAAARLSPEEISSRFADTKQALGRLERGQHRNADCKLLIDEIRGNLQMLSGEYAGILRAIQAGKIGLAGADATLLAPARLRQARRLLLDLCVPDEQFLAAAQRVFAILVAGWPREQISPEARSVSGES